MNIWIIIYASITLIGLGIDIANHGQIKKEKQTNAWTTIIAVAIVYFILYKAGLFTLL